MAEARCRVDGGQRCLVCVALGPTYCERPADEALFPGYESTAQEPLSADRRRTLRQQQDVELGRHPLTGGPLHPLASRHRDAYAPKADPLTCGSCYFRQTLSAKGGSYPKCVADDGRRVSHSPASDVRAWWPACPDYTPGDTRLSPDAARGFPE